MNTSIKAALLSALVFPGCGQLWLRRYRSGGALLAVTLLALVFVVRYAVQQATLIADKIIAGEIPLDAQVIAQRVSAIVDNPDSSAVNAAAWVIVACWLIGIVDAYRAGRSAAPELTPR
jgi:hypothetical protein